MSKLPRNAVAKQAPVPTAIATDRPQQPSKGPARGARARSRINTKGELQYAILRLQRRAEKISIASVAREAGVSAALIHNTYVDTAEQIRQLAGKSSREQRDAKNAALVEERQVSRALREEMSQLRQDMARMASVNLKLQSELSLFKGMAQGKVIPMPHASPQEKNLKP